MKSVLFISVQSSLQGDDKFSNDQKKIQLFYILKWL